MKICLECDALPDYLVIMLTRYPSFDITEARFESGIPLWTSWLVVGMFIFAVVTVYFMLFGVYRPQNVDDAWYLSFAFNWLELGVTDDIGFGWEFGGTRYFHMTYAIVYGTIADPLGWTKGASHVVSLLIGFASLPFWFSIGKQVGLSVAGAIVWILLIVWLEPFFGAANQARPDMLVFFFIGVSVFLFLRGRPFFALLVAGVAFETHPAGLYAYIYIAALYLGGIRGKPVLDREDYRAAALGLFAGILYYAVLHFGVVFDVVSVLVTGASRTGIGADAHTIYDAYFLKTSFMRHLPELVVIVVAAWLFFRRGGWSAERPIAMLFIVVAASGVIMRPNFHYMLFLYPALLLPVVWVADEYQRLTALMIGFLLLLAPQYGVVYAMNRDYSLNEYIELARSTVPDDELPVAAEANGWFAFNDRRFFYLDYNGEFLSRGVDAFYLVEDEEYRNGGYRLEGRIEEAYRRTFVGTFAFNGEVFAVFRMTPAGQQSSPRRIPLKSPYV